MKKCASCSKDLPDAALHCVFCGAKQATAPVSSTAANAKTVMGNYSASDMIAALKAGGNLPSAAAITPPAAPVVGTPPAQPPRNASGPTPAPYAPPQAVQSPYAPAPPRPAPAMNPPAAPPAIRPAPPSSPPAFSTPSSGPPSMPPPLAHGVPTADSAAKTVMAQAPVIPQSPAAAAAIAQGPTGQGAGPSAWAPPAASPPPAPPASGTAPSTPSTPATPSTPEPEPVAPPYLASQTAARAGRPVEPWKQTLRMVMFIFGVLAIAYMAIPKSLDPLQFALFGIIENEGTAKIEPILVGAIGVFGLIFSFTPMPAMPRGLLAGILGLAYAVVPTILKGLDTDIAWQALALPGSMVFLIPGLVLRSEYKDSILPRILVTLGVLGLLATLLVPVNDNLPLIGLIETVIDGDLEHKIAALLGLLVAVMAVLSLLVWLPAPSGGGAKVFAWFFILFPLFEHIYKVLYTEDVVNLITATPAHIFVGWAPATAAFAFLGYGMATVLGKSLE